MKVSLDGGVTFQEAPNGVRVVYENLDVPGEDDTDGGELHVNHTDEGIIMDVWVNRGSCVDNLDHNIATSSETVNEIVERMVEADA